MLVKEHRFEWEIQILVALLATALLTLGCIVSAYRPLLVAGQRVCQFTYDNVCERDRLVEMAEYHAIVWKPDPSTPTD